MHSLRAPDRERKCCNSTSDLSASGSQGKLRLGIPVAYALVFSRVADAYTHQNVDAMGLDGTVRPGSGGHVCESQTKATIYILQLEGRQLSSCS